jgi:DNA-binding IclR family transcriptional regulator
MSPYAAKILKTINDSRRPLNISDLKRKTGFAWGTSKRYANELVDSKLVKCERGHSHFYSKVESEA